MSKTLVQTMMSRRSIRRYLDQAVPRERIEALLTAAIWAPSAHNRQPWRFVVVQSKSEKESLAQAMGDRLRHDLKQDGVPEQVITADVTRSYSRMTSAAVLIVVCMSMSDMDVYPDEKRAANEYIMAVQSTAMAGQNLLLAAHEINLAACWMCAPLFCPEVVREALELPADWQPQGIVTLGYPAEEREKTRKPLEAVVEWR